MKKEDFIKKGLMGTGVFTNNKLPGAVVKNDIDELKELELIGFDHLTATETATNTSTVLHKSVSRGHANHGWLDSKQSFSFANYYNADRMHFGVLRVLNDDVVDAGMGFGRHPHDNMEIISIPLEGDLEHKDSMGNVAVIKRGDIQAMSAGTGIFHSEYNKHTDQHAKFLQIWVFPKTKNVAPRYDQITLDVNDRHNKLQQILSPNKEDEGVWINQDAWFHLGTFDKNFVTIYQLKNPENGVYAFVIKGDVTIENNALNERDGLGIWNTGKISITANSQDAEVLLMEVPMRI